MTAGRKPKPLSTLKLSGQYRADRHADRQNAPKPAKAETVCPKWLTGEAKRTWERLAPELSRLGLLTKLDHLLEAYCWEWSLYVSACKQLKDAAGCTETTTNGNEVQKALAGIRSRALANCLKIASEYGLTPSSRERLRAHPNDEPDLAALIEKNRYLWDTKGVKNA